MGLGRTVSSELGCLFDSPPNHTRAFSAGRGRLRRLDPANLHHQVDTVEQRSRDSLPVSTQDSRSTLAGLATIAMEATRTWIGSSHKMKRGRKLSRHSPTGNGDEPVLQRLTECVEIASRKLGKLIEK
jgi:hypothetical protein